MTDTTDPTDTPDTTDTSGSAMIDSRVIPHLIVKGAADAIDFYGRAFGAVEQRRLDGPDGLVMHACVTIERAPIFLIDERPDEGLLGPLAVGGTPVSLHVIVPDVDAAFAQAVQAGATALMEPADQSWGRPLRDARRPLRSPLGAGDRTGFWGGREVREHSYRQRGRAGEQGRVRRRAARGRSLLSRTASPPKDRPSRCEVSVASRR